MSFSQCILTRKRASIAIKTSKARITTYNATIIFSILYLLFNYFVKKISTMVILVDYDNIDREIRRKGLYYMVSRIVSKINSNEISNARRINLRLYGGWYELNTATRIAQNLSTEIANDFPTTLTLNDNSTNVFVNCELAYSLLASPYQHLFHTYRKRGKPTGLNVQHPSQCGCNDQNCPLLIIPQFFQLNNCIQCNSVKPEDVFYKGEQKLVDTMLTSDLIFVSFNNDNLCIVSSDDDFWPGIMTSLYLGSRVLHLKTKKRLGQNFYNTGKFQNYSSRTL